MAELSPFSSLRILYPCVIQVKSCEKEPIATTETTRRDTYETTPTTFPTTADKVPETNIKKYELPAVSSSDERYSTSPELSDSSNVVVVDMSTEIVDAGDATSRRLRIVNNSRQTVPNLLNCSKGDMNRFQSMTPIEAVDESSIGKSNGHMVMTSDDPRLVTEVVANENEDALNYDIEDNYSFGDIPDILVSDASNVLRSAINESMNDKIVREFSTTCDDGKPFTLRIMGEEITDEDDENDCNYADSPNHLGSHTVNMSGAHFKSTQIVIGESSEKDVDSANAGISSRVNVKVAFDKDLAEIDNAANHPDNLLLEGLGLIKARTGSTRAVIEKSKSKSIDEEANISPDAHRRRVRTELEESMKREINEEADDLPTKASPEEDDQDLENSYSSPDSPDEPLLVVSYITNSHLEISHDAVEESLKCNTNYESDVSDDYLRNMGTPHLKREDPAGDDIEEVKNLADSADERLILSKNLNKCSSNAKSERPALDIGNKDVEDVQNLADSPDEKLSLSKYLNKCSSGIPDVRAVPSSRMQVDQSPPALETAAAKAEYSSQTDNPPNYKILRSSQYLILEYDSDNLSDSKNSEINFAFDYLLKALDDPNNSMQQRRIQATKCLQKVFPNQAFRVSVNIPEATAQLQDNTKGDGGDRAMVKLLQSVADGGDTPQSSSTKPPERNDNKKSKPLRLNREIVDKLLADEIKSILRSHVPKEMSLTDDLVERVVNQSSGDQDQRKHRSKLEQYESTTLSVENSKELESDPSDPSLSYVPAAPVAVRTPVIVFDLEPLTMFGSILDLIFLPLLAEFYGQIVTSRHGVEKGFCYSKAPTGKRVQFRVTRVKRMIGRDYHARIELDPNRSEDLSFTMAAHKAGHLGPSEFAITMGSRMTPDHTIGRLKESFDHAHHTLYDEQPGKAADSNEIASIQYYVIHRRTTWNNAFDVKLNICRKPKNEFKAAPREDKSSGRQKSKRSSNDAPDSVLLLHNKIPTKNEFNKARMDFNDRARVTSVKNIQLVADNDVTNIYMQCGRLNALELTLDYKSPMSALQAFGIMVAMLESQRNTM